MASIIEQVRTGKFDIPLSDGSTLTIVPEVEDKLKVMELQEKLKKKEITDTDFYVRMQKIYHDILARSYPDLTTKQIDLLVMRCELDLQIGLYADVWGIGKREEFDKIRQEQLEKIAEKE